MKKVPHWIKKVIAFTQLFPCAETRNRILDELISGEFDLQEFEQLCRDCHFAYDDKGNQISEPNYGAFFNQWEAVEAAGKYGNIESMQGILHRVLSSADQN
jgi:hypothetical protein